MEIIIQQFLDKVINLEEKNLENLNNINFLSDFTDNLKEELMKLGREFTKDYLNELEKLIYNSPERKEKYNSYQKDSEANKRKLITIFGEIEFSRRYYMEKINNENKEYLLDKAIGVAENERMLINVEENLLELATIKSYEFAGKKAAYDTVISKKTVKNKILQLDFSNKLKEEYLEKTKIPRLYIQADEDHVSLQKGGIAMPKIITVFEDNVNGKLINKKKFGGIYDGKIDDLWEEVLTYIESKYDTDLLKDVFIIGDGASWIKTGTKWIINSKYIADKFHINQAIIKMTGSKKEYISEIRNAIFALDFEKVKELEYEILAEEMNSNKRKYMEKNLKYILNIKEGIKNSLIYDLPGCSAESDVSHVFSDRLSSRPLGWSKGNVDKIARLRIAKANGENIRLITRNIKNIDEIVLKNQNKVSKMIHKDRYKREDGICYSIPEINYGNYETRMKISELISYKAI